MTVAYDPETALIVVDVQNDFARPEGSLYVRGGEEVVPPINREVQRALDAGAFVVYTQDWHPPHTPHFHQDGGIWPVHCVAESWGAALDPALAVRGPVVRKGTGGEDGYSGFSVRDPRSGAGGETGLEAILREHRIQRAVIAGLATDYCVRETALDAVRRGFSTTVLRDAIRAVDLQPGDGERAIADMEAAGAQIASAGE
jgi:nicotinamidase/pyrazinamidase